MKKILLVCVALALLACLALPALVEAEGTQAVTFEIIHGQTSYTVPDGRVLYICNIYLSGSSHVLDINGVPVAYFSGSLNSPVVAGAGDILSVRGGPVTINGYLTGTSTSPGPIGFQMPTFMLTGLALVVGGAFLLARRSRLQSW